MLENVIQFVGRPSWSFDACPFRAVLSVGVYEQFT